MIKKESPVKTPHLFLIDDQADKECELSYSGSFGIGAGFNWNGQYCRVAVRIKDTATVTEFKKAWKMLKKAVKNPEAPESKAAFGVNELIGNEMISWEGRK